MFSFQYISAQETETIIPTTLKELKENPEKYHDKKIAISGYLNLEFEGNALYASKSDCNARFYNKGAYLHISTEKRYALKDKDVNHIYVSLTATFRKDMKGHFGLWLGGLTDIENIQLKE